LKAGVNELRVLSDRTPVAAARMQGLSEPVFSTPQ